MALLARPAGLSWSRGISRRFCFEKLNFSNASVAYKIMMPNDKVVLNDLLSALAEKGTCK